MNHLHEPQSVQIDIRTRWLRREIFAEAFDVPEATDSAGIEYEPDVLPQPRSYRVSVTHDGQTFTVVRRIACENLDVHINGSTWEYRPPVEIRTTTWEPNSASDE